MARGNRLPEGVFDSISEPKERIRGAENRTTVLLQARVKPEVKSIAESKAIRADMTISEYISNLVTGSETPSPSPGSVVSEALLYHLAGSHVLRLLKAEEGKASPELAELKEIRRLIVMGQLSFRGEYEAEISARNPQTDEWTET